MLDRTNYSLQVPVKMSNPCLNGQQMLNNDDHDESELDGITKEGQGICTIGRALVKLLSCVLVFYISEFKSCPAQLSTSELCSWKVCFSNMWPLIQFHCRALWASLFYVNFRMSKTMSVTDIYWKNPHVWGYALKDKIANTNLSTKCKTGGIENWLSSCCHNCVG